jgi:TolB-like protein
MSEDPTKQATSGHDVFVSYASQDVAVADAVVSTLEKNGLRCWIAPRDVTPGTLYADGIIRAINEAKVLVLVLSASSSASKHVGKEVERASSKGRPIIALRVDATPLTTALEYFLSESQWIDAAALGMPGALAKLRSAVGQALAAPPGVNPVLGAGPATAETPVAHRPVVVKRVALAAGVLVALVVSVTLGIHFWPSKRPEAQAPTVAAISDKSIAVLPFADMSEKKDQEYFADGIAEEVLDRLAQVPGIKVVGRASSFQFKGKSSDLASIGSVLGVAYLLQGSVRKDAGRVRVAAQLVETRTGAQRWSDHFDSDVVDVLKIQDTIAAALARALQTAVEVDAAPRSSVKSPEALDAYLRGRQSLDRDTRESCDAAVAYFQQALHLDPTLAPAAMGLSKANVYIGRAAWLPTKVAFERAREAALLAQRLDPRSPLPHVLMANIHMSYDWDWTGVDRELQQAFALGPRESYAVQVAAALAAARGQWDEARQLGIEAIALDPLDVGAHMSLGLEVYLRSGRLAEAEQSFRRARQIAPESNSIHYFLGLVLMLQGHHEQALAEFGKETLDDGQLEGLAMVHFAAGRKIESNKFLAEAIRHNGPSWASEIARVFAFRGEKDHAFEWLDKAYEARDEDLYFIKDDPLVKNLEGDSRYKAFLKKMNFPE